MYENNNIRKERFILVAAVTLSEKEAEYSLNELAELARTAGAEVAGTVVQAREQINPATYIGSGKVQEILSLLYMNDADGIICDDELSPVQLKNLTDELDCKVCDRTLLILDIFAARARSSEGKIQVELAQLRYRAARLTGAGRSLSRLGGGIGTRGPGEKKLESDRRLIKERISKLKAQLKDVKKHRDIMRKGREKSGLFSAAIVGYTNAGKSTLLNVLTGSDVFAEDALFATLDPTSRIMNLEHGGEVLLTDTVGFIRKLPHHLVEAFRSTLEEAVYADLIIHVVDSSSAYMESQMRIVYETLDMLGAGGKPVITLFNKIDKKADDARLIDERADEVLNISARYGMNLNRIAEKIEKVFLAGKLYIERIYPYEQAGKVALIRQKGILLEEEFLPEGIAVKAYIPIEIA